MAGSANVALRARGNKFKVTLAGGSEEQRADVRRTLTALAELNLEIAELAAAPKTPAADAHAVNVLMFMLNDDPELWTEELRPWVSGGSWALVAAVLTKHSSGLMRQALRAGANEVLFYPIDSVDVARLLVKVSETHHNFREVGGKAAYALVGVAGGAGVSTLSVLLGLALQGLTGQKVALIDLGLQSSALSALLDLQPQHTISDLIDPTSAIDSIRLEPVICKHASGLHVLCAPRAIEEAELVSAATVEAAMTVMTQLFDYVVVDCGHHVTEGLVTAWERSGSVLYVLNQSIVSVRCAQRFLDLFDRLNLAHVSLDLLLNRFHAAHPISAQKIEGALRRQIALRFPHDETVLTRAEAEGGITALPSRSAAMAAAERLARMLLGGQYATNGARPRNVFSRLFGGAADH